MLLQLPGDPGSKGLLRPVQGKSLLRLLLLRERQPRVGFVNSVIVICRQILLTKTAHLATQGGQRTRRGASPQGDSRRPL